MLGQAARVEIIEDISRHLERVMQPGGSSAARISRPARRRDRQSRVLHRDAAGGSQRSVVHARQRARPAWNARSRAPSRVVPTVPPLGAASYARTVRIEPPLGRTAPALSEAEDRDAPSARAGARRRCWRPRRRASRGGARSGSDALFIEEANEEVARIQQQFPVWDHNPLEGEALLDRAPLVPYAQGQRPHGQARQIRRVCLGGRESAQPPARGHAAALAAGARDAARGGRAAAAAGRELEAASAGRTDVAPLAARAHALASGREVPARRRATLLSQPAAVSRRRGSRRCAPRSRAAPRQRRPPRAPAPAADCRRPGRNRRAPPSEAGRPRIPTRPGTARDLCARDREPRGRGASLDRARAARTPAPHRAPEEVFRACHTLVGSSKMAEARHGIRLAEPINHWLRKSFDSGVGLDDSDLMLLGDVHERRWKRSPGTWTRAPGIFVVHDTLRARIARAELELDRRIAEAAAVTERSASSCVPPMPEQIVMAAPPAQRSREQARSPPERAAAAERGRAAGFDPEIAAIFSEEAVELLEVGRAALRRGMPIPQDARRWPRCAGRCTRSRAARAWPASYAMGDLAHELESLITRIESGRHHAAERARERGAAGDLDELSRMREHGARGRPAAGAPSSSTGSCERYRWGIVGSAAGARAPRGLRSRLPSRGAGTGDAAASGRGAAGGDRLAQRRSRRSRRRPGRRRRVAAAVPDGPAGHVGGGTPGAGCRSPSPGRASRSTSRPPWSVPPGREPSGRERSRRRLARVNAELLDQLLNSAGEVSIAPCAARATARAAIEFNLGELFAYRYATEGAAAASSRSRPRRKSCTATTTNPGHRQEFDPLELDRYSSIQQFSRTGRVG